ncbi:spore coat U domain-containing protein [Palleronia sp. LCG004]|uniref:Csu type fimbrial protein n=1 Tax=Palleronia sp. LCG004 TaxID=3079304 RepID=UPI00294295C7|nr:spore coat U domain-containing protein [Palleronia sp. LCG004]WOI58437.1 spore coat U domain-containing protein [Palleronia sp. LCG004]
MAFHALLIGSISASAQTSELTVTAVVANECTINATTLDFANLNLGASTTEQSPGLVEVVCTAASPVTVTVDGGDNQATGVRRMSNGSGGFVPYSIFTGIGRATPIGIGGTILSDTLASATPRNLLIYGLVPGSTVYPAGSYSDTLTVTLSY